MRTVDTVSQANTRIKTMAVTPKIEIMIGMTIDQKVTTSDVINIGISEEETAKKDMTAGIEIDKIKRGTRRIGIMTDGKEAIAETEVIVEVQNVVEIVVMVTVEVEVEKDQKGIVVIAEVGVGKEVEGVNITVQKNADTVVTIAMIQGLQCQGLLKRRRNLTLILLKGK